MDQKIIDDLKAYLTNISSRINRVQFQQEPNYTAAFFGNMSGITFIGESGQFLKFECSVSNDRGINSAESITGVDIGIVVKWENPEGEKDFVKAVLLQAKNNLLKLDARNNRDLQLQCSKMKKITTSYVVMDCPFNGSIPKVGQSDDSEPYWKKDLVSLDDYLIETVFECKDGDTGAGVIKSAMRADRTIVVTTNSPKPKPKPSKKQRL